MTKELAQLAEAAGMVSLLNSGAASCAFSEGCMGVTQAHLQRFADFVRAKERERHRPLINQCRAALSEELSEWDIDTPLHHVFAAHAACVEWLAPPEPAKG